MDNCTFQAGEEGWGGVKRGGVKRGGVGWAGVGWGDFERKQPTSIHVPDCTKQIYSHSQSDEKIHAHSVSPEKEVTWRIKQQAYTLPKKKRC